ncbi:hypothetical protein [Sutcliffiella rhizosphaerae]|uniref:Uncharacterized protein n=1 Tax=Sutcliffiella rhizosphaerae TaxID=2880967 RepID=A0ABM8YMT2_9BACI|nr:hypothetical protein [Sutcliffiella rhizosphaerae]CAG9621207.1 hypothetical protein BACCIP111883_01979 [Sutcliffiella rhizosphaerae]
MVFLQLDPPQIRCIASFKVSFIIGKRLEGFFNDFVQTVATYMEIGRAYKLLEVVSVDIQTIYRYIQHTLMDSNEGLIWN